MRRALWVIHALVAIVQYKCTGTTGTSTWYFIVHRVLLQYDATVLIQQY